MQANHNAKIDIIFNKWCSLRKSIGKKKPELTTNRKKYICELLSKKSLKDVELILDYFTKSRDEYITFMKTERHGRYTGLEYIFRETKFSDKLERARYWKKKTRYVEAKDIYLPYTIEYKGGSQ